MTKTKAIFVPLDRPCLHYVAMRALPRHQHPRPELGIPTSQYRDQLCQPRHGRPPPRRDIAVRDQMVRTTLYEAAQILLVHDKMVLAQSLCGADRQAARHENGDRRPGMLPSGCLRNSVSSGVEIRPRKRLRCGVPKTVNNRPVSFRPLLQGRQRHVRLS